MDIKYIIREIIDDIKNDKSFCYFKDLLIVGENTSGKSKILKDAINELIKDEKIYFIGSPNRNILTERKDLKNNFSKLDITRIIKNRIADKNLNLNDVFTEDTRTELVLNELITEFGKYSVLFKKILDIDIGMKNIEPSNSDDRNSFVMSEAEQEEKDIVLVNNKDLKLASDSQHAMMRMLMEVNFAYENGKKIIFIDEIDKHLDYDNASDFLIKLKDNYNELKFIVVSHSIYTVLGIKDFDILKIYKQYDDVTSNECRFFNSNDMDSLELINKKIFIGSQDVNQVDLSLSNILQYVLGKNKVNEKMLDELPKEEELSPRQKVIYEYIKERMGK